MLKPHFGKGFDALHTGRGVSRKPNQIALRLEGLTLACMVLGVAVVAALGMLVLAPAKMRVADEIGSWALRAGTMDTFTSGFLSGMLLAELGANMLMHSWWLDSMFATSVRIEYRARIAHMAQNSENQ